MSSKEKFDSESVQPIVAFKWNSVTRKFWITIIVLAVILAATVITVIGLAAALGVERSSGDSQEELCLTEDCVQLASRILSSMDQSIDPCQDFYNFSCGRYEDNNVTPLDAGHGRNTGIFDAADTLTRQNIRAFHDILTGNNGDDIEAVVKAKDLYRLCLNKDQVNAQSIPDLVAILRETGGWPLIGMLGDGTPWDINGTQFRMEKLLRSEAFFDWVVQGDLANSNINIINIFQSGLTLERPNLYSDSVVSANDIHIYTGDYKMTDQLKKLVVTTLNRLSPRADNDTYAAAADGIVQVESALAYIYDNVSQDTILTIFRRVTLGELPELSNYTYDWIGNLQNIFTSLGIKIDESEPVNLLTPNYFKQLRTTLEKFDSEMLQNYARWQLVRRFFRVLDTDCVDAFMQLESTITNNGIPEREEMCVGMVQEFLPLAVWRPFAVYVLSDGARSTASEMTTEIKAAFRERVADRTWLDETTRGRCLKKVDNMTQNIAYPDMLLDNDYVNEQYESFQIFSDSLVRTFESFQRLSLEQMFSRLRERVNQFQTTIDDKDGPFVVNAFYSPMLNQMVILSTIMRSPYFNAAWPIYIRFGALGYVIGHEITHGFDSNGRLYNETGQMETWWTNASATNFDDRTKCYVNQYSQYTFFNTTVNGTQTLAENIADNGGIAIAYQAYKTIASRRGPGQLLPSLSQYTRDQLFYIATAQTYCTAYTPEGYRNLTARDVHSPNIVRVLGLMSNSPEFAEAFQCAPGTPMNPRDKCALW